MPSSPIFPESNAEGSNPKESAKALPKTYDPKGTESRWQIAWERDGAFQGKPDNPGKAFSVVIPPPNVTGSLHMGHAFNTALIDTIVRFQRLQGKNVLCLPGTDHASIAVQTILEKQLKEEGINRSQLGRKEFLNRAWEWKNKSGGQIVGQLKRLGYSVDWKRERFTLDEKLSKAVNRAFIQLYEKGLIYRGEYLVNWCPASGSAVSDLEVEMKEVNGHLWHFRYPLTSGKTADGVSHIEVATTRPETMLGDVAVAVNPSDKRYKKLIGEMITLPLVNRQIPIIADEHVDKSFGTGCVKVTPAHDPNDFAIGQRHNLPQITVMNKNGSMNNNAGHFEGLDRFEARKSLVEALDKKGYLVKVEPYQHNVPFSERGKVPIEPLISTQWFIRMEPLATKAKVFLEHNDPKFIPERWTKVYRDWLTDIRDWCISRQLWWGHQIPAWFVISESNGQVTNKTPYIVAESIEEAQRKAKKKFGESAKIQQDEDVLDTWFSSGLWPFSTLGWPNEEDIDFKRWYPTSTLVTGFDIIFFWVARMTMMASIFTDKMPFKDVYIHGLVRDEENRKMSKSAGNGIDPLLLIERYGVDALRFALVREVAGAGQDIRLDYDRQTDTSSTVEASRNFANKLWNATRFALIHLGNESQNTLGEINPNALNLSDLWILSRLTRVNIKAKNSYENYNLGEVAKDLYEFVWHDFCDWYLELVKNRLNQSNESTTNYLADQKTARQVLAKVLSDLLIMLHPLMPHLTEELWHGLTGNPENQFLALEIWPKSERDYLNSELEESFDELIKAISVVRNLRAVAGLKPSQKVPVRFITNRKELAKTLLQAKSDIEILTRTKSLEVIDQESANKNPSTKVLAGVSGELQVLLPIEGLVDLESLRSRLEKDLFKAEKDIASLSERLNNSNFTNKAPTAVVAQCKENLSEAYAQAVLTRKRLEDLA